MFLITLDFKKLFLVSGHHGKVTGMSFSGGNDQDSSRYVATVSGEQITCPLCRRLTPLETTRC